MVCNGTTNHPGEKGLYQALVVGAGGSDVRTRNALTGNLQKGQHSKLQGRFILNKVFSTYM